MSNIITNVYRKEEDGSLKAFYFPSTGSVISLTGYTPYASTPIPAITADTTALDAIRYIDANIKKLSSEKVNTSSLATVATSGKYSDLTGKPTIPTNISDLNNDSGFITSVSWNDILNKPSSYTPSSHTQASSTITSMAGYTIQDADEIVVNDTLNQAIGKLEGSLNNKVSKGETVAQATKATQDGSGNVITSTYVKAVTSSDNTVTVTKGDGSKTTFAISDSDEKVKSEPNGTVKAFLVGTTSSATSTGTTVFDPNIYTTSTAGELVATKFTGTLNGKANTASQADKLSSAKSISLTGAVTGSASFDGSTNASIATTLANIDASKITSGIIDIARLPKAAISELKIVADDDARFALTTSDIQNGDTVQVTSTGKMYFVKDQTKLSTEDGYAVYTAGAASSVDWSGITNKPTSFTPASHTQAASTITGLAVVATSGNYSDLNGKPTIPSKTSQLTNDSGYITGVAWGEVTGKPTTFAPASHTQAASTITGLATVATSGKYSDLSGKPTIPTAVSELTNDSGYLTTVGWADVTDKPTSFTPAAHNQASNTITALTGYSKPASTAALGTSDNLNTALGKLEKALDSKLSTTGTAAKATADAAGNTIATTYIKGLSVSGKVITYTKGDGSTGTITTQDTNTTYSVMTGATSSADGAIGLVPKPTAGNQGKYLRADGTWATPPDTNTWTAFKGATSSAAGTAGYVPAPAAGDQAKFFRADGTWVVPTNTTYSASNGISLSGTTFSNSGVRSIATGSANGTISVNTNGTSADVAIKGLGSAAYTASSAYAAASHTQAASTITGLATVATSGSYADLTNKPTIPAAYSLPDATASVKGGVKIGSNITISGGTISLTKANVTAALGYTPPTTNTTYSVMTGATSSAAGTAGLVPAPAAGAQAKYLRADGTWQTPPDTNTTYSASNGISLSGTTFSNSGVRSIATGSSNGTISVNTNGSTANVAVKGLGSAAYTASSAYAAASHTHPQDNNFIAHGNEFNFIPTLTDNTDIHFNYRQTGGNNTSGYKITNYHFSNGAGSTDGVNVIAGTFSGALSGNAATATKATQDSAGQQINTTYIKGLSVSGKTITYTKGDGTTGTITTQDTNTTYSAFKGATSSAAGGTGLVPAPAAGAQAKYLRADGTWQTPPDTNTTYSAATSSNLGLVKIGSNISVSSGTISLTKANITNALGYTPPTTDTNTHYTTHAKVGASATATANAAASNGSVYLNILDDSTVRDSHLIKGAGATTVTSDANGVITISSTDTNTNTTYSAGTGISLSGTTFSNAGVRSIATGSSNGTISVNTNGTTANVAVKGLGSAAYSNTSAFAAASHSHSNYALKTDIPSIWDSDGHLVSPAGWKMWVAD